MLFTVAFSAMFFSSIYIILFTNHLTAAHKKEMKSLAKVQKDSKPLQEEKAAEVDKEVLVEAC